jgi:hypothetical protein
MFKAPQDLKFALVSPDALRKDSALEIEGNFRDEEDVAKDSDDDYEESESLEKILEKLSTALPHRGPQSKTKYVSKVFGWVTHCLGCSKDLNFIIDR